jgi:hypothetical protein
VADDAHGQPADAVIAALVGRDARVLDLGASSEALVELLAHQGCTIVAVAEERTRAAVLAAFAERVIVADPETLAFRDALGGETFDVVVAAGVSELVRPEQTLAASIPFVRQGGAYVLSLPNAAHAAVRLAGLAGNLPLSPGRGRKPLHWYDLDGARTLIEEAGLRITETRRVSAAVEPKSLEGQTAVPAGVIEWVSTQPEASTSAFVFHCVVDSSTAARSRPQHHEGRVPADDDGVARLQALTLIEMNLKVAAVTKEMGELSVERDRLRRRVQQQARRLREAQSLIETFQRSRAVKMATALRRVEGQLRGLLRRP